MTLYLNNLLSFSGNCMLPLDNGDYVHICIYIKNLKCLYCFNCVTCVFSLNYHGASPSGYAEDLSYNRRIKRVQV